MVPEVGILGYLWIACTASLGTIALAAGLENYLLRNCSFIERILLLLTAPLMLYPGYLTDFIGIALLSGVFLYQKLSDKQSDKQIN